MTASARRPMVAPARVLIEDRPGLAAFTAMHKAGRPLVLALRVSNDSSAPQNVASIASNLETSSRALSEAGIDIGHLLPDPAEIYRRACTEADLVKGKDPDGGDLRHHFFVLDLRAAGLLILVTLGSGKKIDHELHQPAADHLARSLLAYDPAGVFTPAADRLARTAMATICLALEHLALRHGEPVFYGTVDRRFGVFDDGAALELELHGVIAGREAAAIARRTREGRITAMEQMRWEHDRCRWPLVAAPMPGLARAQLADGTSGRRRPWAYLDRDGSRPTGPDLIWDDCAVVGADDKRIDQVALVRWLLAHYGLPGWDPKACAEWLIQHGYSTSATRQQRHDPTAVVGLGRSGRNYSGVCRTILGHLDEYEACEVRVGFAGVTVAVTGVSPGPEGWASPADYARIRGYRKARRMRTEHQRTRVAAGLELTYNDVPARLVSETHNDPVRYQIHDREPTPVRGPDRAPVLHTDLMALVVAAIRSAGADLLPFIDPRRRDAAEQAAAAAAAVNGQITGLTQRQQRRMELLDPPDGSDALTGAARTELDRRYNDDQQVLAALRVQAAALTEQVQAAASLDTGRGVALDTVLPVLPDLVRDPFSAAARTWLRPAVSDLTVDDTPAGTIAGRPLYRRHWWIQLVFRDGERAFSATASASRLFGPGLVMPNRLTDAVDGLRAGWTLPATLGAGWRYDLPLLRHTLTESDAHFPFGTDGADPQLLRLIMAVAYPAPTDPDATRPVPGCPIPMPVLARAPLTLATLPALAAELGVPVALLRRIHRLYARPADRPLRYLLDPAPRAAALYARTTDGAPIAVNLKDRAVVSRRAAADWVSAGRGRIQLRPCRCGSRTRVLSRLREVDTSICLGCRTDRSGVAWPGDPYDQYLR